MLVAGRDLNLFGPELWVAPNQSAAISAKQISGPCNQLDAAFESLVQQRIGALLVGSGAFVFGRRDRLGALAASYAIPAIYDLRDYVAASGLISYGANITRAYRQVGIHVGQILNGAKPAELPVIEAANVELVLNLKTAKTLGLTIPPSTLGRADEVIE